MLVTTASNVMKKIKYKARPSSVGNLFTQPKLKADREAGNLSQTAKSMLQLWVKEQIYERDFPFDGNKSMENGTISEDNSIEILENNSEFVGLKKNEVTFENDWIKGTPDLVLEDKIIDIKTSFSGKTFPLFETEVTNQLYYYQLQAYMFLTGKKKAELVYVLGDIDETIILKEFNYSNSEDYDEFRKYYIYENIDSKYRIKRLEVEYDQDFEEELKETINKAREYVEYLYEHKI